jgi:hypothetical protein
MKHTTLFNIVAAVFVLVGVSACSSNDDGDEPTNPTPTDPTERKLVIGVSANPWLDENGNARETRGAVITTQSLKDFYIDFWLNSDRNQFVVNRVGNDINNSWSPTPNSNWPRSAGDETPISFYAHTAGTCNIDDSGYYYISFNSDEASGFQHDLLLSKITNVTYNGTGGVIWFTFDHACAAVEFNIQITKKLRNQLKTALTVNSVVLKNVAKTGDCYYSNNSGNHIGEWKNVNVPQGNDESGYYTLTQAEAMLVDTVPVALPCNTMFVIPQTLGSDSKLEIGYTLPGSVKKDTIISLADTEWKAGHLYPINIVLGTKLIFGTTQTENP